MPGKDGCGLPMGRINRYPPDDSNTTDLAMFAA